MNLKIHGQNVGDLSRVVVRKTNVYGVQLRLKMTETTDL